MGTTDRGLDLEQEQDTDKKTMMTAREKCFEGKNQGAVTKNNREVLQTGAHRRPREDIQAGT